MKAKLLFFFLGMILTFQGFATTYYSQGSVAPNVTANWNTIRGGGGSSPAAFTAGDVFVIQNGHSMTTSGTWSVSGTGSKLWIENGGTLTANHNVTLNSATVFQIDNGGTYVQNVVSSMGSNVLSGTEVFGASSHFIYNFAPSGTSAPSSPGYGNLTINTSTNGTNLGWAGTITQVQGNFSIQSTGTGTIRHALTAGSPITVNVGGNLTLSGTNTNFWLSSGAGTCTLTVAGDVIVSESANFDLANSSGAGTLNIGGDFTQTGGTFLSKTAISTVSFTGSGTSISSVGTITPTNINWNITSSASITLNSPFTVASSRQMVIDGTLATTSTITSTGTTYVAGTFQINAGGSISASPTYTVSTCALVYNTGGAYTAGNEWTTGLYPPQNVTIQNPGPM